MQKSRLVWMIFIISLLSTIGSLYYSFYGDIVANVLTGDLFNRLNGLPVCDMCRYIRMSSYSLVFISAAMLIYRDYDKVHYIWPLTVIGLFFSGYKYRLQKFADGADSGICLSGVSCSDIAVEYFGFMTLPFMGMIAFGLILAATWLIYTDR